MSVLRGGFIVVIKKYLDSYMRDYKMEILLRDKESKMDSKKD
jgi:hypothetical protein